VGSSLWPGLLLGLTEGLGTAWSPRLAWGLGLGLRRLGVGVGGGAGAGAEMELGSWMDVHAGQAPLLSCAPARVHDREHWTPT